MSDINPQRNGKPSRPRVVRQGEQGVSVLMEQTDNFGTDDPAVIEHLLRQAVPAKGESVEARAAVALGLLHDIQPRDTLEAMLAVQMVKVHDLAMQCTGRAERASDYQALNTNVAHVTKLLRLFTDQLEALNRYRGKGQQKVTVEHVHVNQGGQALVGTVEPSGGEGKPWKVKLHSKNRGVAGCEMATLRAHLPTCPAAAQEHAPVPPAVDRPSETAAVVYTEAFLRALGPLRAGNWRAEPPGSMGAIALKPRPHDGPLPG